MELNIVSPGSKSTKKVEVSDTVFGVKFNDTLVHQMVTTYLTNARQGSKAQKNRSAVSGGGAKPWRQKGTGRARAGTIRSPIWRSGGVTFAASPKTYDVKINRKMVKSAMRSILSRLAKDERFVVVDDFTVEAPKTKAFIEKFKSFELTGRVLIVTEGIDEALYLAARNVPNVSLVDTHTIDPVTLLNGDKIIITVPALKQLEEKFA